MKVAKASLSQMPFHQFIVTRSPNHMCAFSCETTSAMRSSSAREAVFSSASSAVSRKVIAPRFSIAPAAKVGNRDEIELVARIRDAVIVGEKFERESANRLSLAGEVAFAWDMDDAQGRTGVDGVRRFELADDEGEQIGGHPDGVFEDDLFLAAAEFALRLDAGVGERSQIFVDNEGNSEDRLERGLVPAREGTARVGRLELSGRNSEGLAGGVGVLAAIETMQLVVEHAAKFDHERPGTGSERLAEMRRCARSRAGSSSICAR